MKNPQEPARYSAFVSKKTRDPGVSNAEWKACKRKRMYESDSEAAKDWRGRTYRCRYCSGWHRAGGDLIAVARQNYKRLRGQS